MQLSPGAIAIVLVIVSLWLFIAIDAFHRWRTRHDKALALAALDDEDDEVTAVRRRTVVSPAPPDSEDAAREVAAHQPWFKTSLGRSGRPN